MNRKISGAGSLTIDFCGCLGSCSAARLRQDTNAIISILVTRGIIGVLRTNAALLVESSLEFH